VDPTTRPAFQILRNIFAAATGEAEGFVRPEVDGVDSRLNQAVKRNQTDFRLRGKRLLTQRRKGRKGKDNHRLVTSDKAATHPLALVDFLARP
jgi:hypothetical protein